MTREQIIKLQQHIGASADGFWGPVSIAACQRHLRAIMRRAVPRWPDSDPASLRDFYGAPGDESRLVTIVFPFPTFYDGQLVRSTRCHEKCASSLLRVLTSIGQGFGQRRDVIDAAADYSGCYNNRPKRGGSSPSLHAYGAAIDLDADENTFRDHWPLQADMPIEVMEAFASEGWLSAGAFWGYDAMHFQATR